MAKYEKEKDYISGVTPFLNETHVLQSKDAP
jgi:hypothetical protein